MLIMLVTDGVQYADYLLGNPLILEDAEAEATIHHIACMLSKATKRERSLVYAFIRGMTTPPEELERIRKAQKREAKRAAKAQE